MKDKQTSIPTTFNFMFWLHLFLTVISWFGPFLFSWYLIIPAYCIVLLQFVFFGRCLMNEGHAIDDSGDHTFYGFILEKLGFRFNRKKLKVFVRREIYFIFTTITLIWQLWLGNAPLLF